MSSDSLKQSYKQRATRFDQKREQLNRKLRLLGFIRLSVMVALVWFIVLGVRDQQSLWFLASAAMLVIFLLLVARYIQLKDLRNLNQRQKDLNLREIGCLDHEFRHLDDGAEFTDPSHPWSHDLDLFGAGSLFQYLNRSATNRGRRHLARTLTEEPGNFRNIRERQDMISDLRDRIDIRQEFTARGEMFHDEAEDIGGIEEWLEDEVYITKNTWLFYLAVVISLSSMGLIVSGFFMAGMFNWLIFILVINFSVLSPFLMRTNRYQQGISKRHELLRGYSLLLEIISRGGFRNPSLMEDSKKAAQGMKEVRKLSRLLNIFDQRLSMLLGPIFNGLFLFDFIMLHLLERWKKINRENIGQWISIVSRTDAFISLSGFAYNHPAFSFPELDEEGTAFGVEALGHPIIPSGKRVDNDLRIDKEKVVIITGANMAGKSTFLRSLGINLVLAYAGCPVCAKDFRMPYMGLFSSMRTADSLAEEESYFFAEIKKLQRIVKEMESGRPLLILLDEVLKGTNTTDKKKGSVGLIHRCIPHPVRCFIATHDLSLGEMEKKLEGQVVNYCFESYIKDLELSFDYRIQKGIATNMNASFLMKKMGIMD